MKLTKQAWILKGVDILKNEGSHALIMDHMCARLRITKGSFYHYFDGIDEFIMLLVKSWEKTTMEQLKQIDASENGVEEKLNLLRNAFFQDTGRTELGLRAISLERKNVKTIIERVNAQRTSMMKKICVGMGTPAHQAQSVAKMVLDAWLGILISGINNPEGRNQSLSQFTAVMMKGM